MRSVAPRPHSTRSRRARDCRRSRSPPHWSAWSSRVAWPPSPGATGSASTDRAARPRAGLAHARVDDGRPKVFLPRPDFLRYYLPLFASPPPMPKSLIIAEKPSVATDIARALGGFTRHDDFYESERYVLSSAVGHLIEIGMPEDEEVKRGKWTFAHLPAIPSKFALKPIDKNENRLRTLLRLIKRKDVDALINACDAGREC